MTEDRRETQNIEYETLDKELAEGLAKTESVEQIEQVDSTEPEEPVEEFEPAGQQEKEDSAEPFENIDATILLPSDLEFPSDDKDYAV